ncbi:PIG-L family deacetylase [Frigoribacterium sp. 2-23]|uniref:PIG-L family deacetylase n=1 Tax=Frigoribacterium sp. 2-23 TaxID=3415006 RepID=UPI003C6EA6D4
MVTFSHLDRGTPEARWAERAPWQAARRLELDRVTGLIVVAAHPDDETLGAGGLIAVAGARGLPIVVIVASDGENSHPESPSTVPHELARLRRFEVSDAVAELAPDADVRFVGLPDGSLRDHTLDLSAVVDAELAALPVSGGDVLLVGTWSDDGHPDHTAVADVCAAAAAGFVGEPRVVALSFPIWAWHWSRPDADDVPWSDALVLPLDEAVRAAKQRALARHVTQNKPLSEARGDEAILSPGLLEHFARPVEVFVENTLGTGGTPAGADADADADADAGADADASRDSGADAGARRDSGLAGAARDSLPAPFFDEFYGDAPDPWGFETRWYETRKRAVTLAALPRERFASALELGCSIGVFTDELADRVDHLLATDIAAAPLRRARERLAGRDHVVFEQRTLPHEWPDGRFDLIVVSEVGYYLSEADLGVLISRLLGSLTDDGVVVTCHWRHDVDEYPLSGDEVTAAFRARGELVRTVTHEEKDFVLDVFSRPPGRSVAEETGLA